MVRHFLLVQQRVLDKGKVPFFQWLYAVLHNILICFSNVHVKICRARCVAFLSLDSQNLCGNLAFIKAYRIPLPALLVTLGMTPVHGNSQRRTMSALQITGNLRKRYIQAAALLRILDPVRGEPTTYGLDYESHSIQDPLDRVLKRKFLDSFALICAVQKKNSDNVLAACLDKDSPEGTVIRIASNAGVSVTTLNDLRDILSFLCNVAARGN
jgi:hypothetical protein